MSAKHIIKVQKILPQGTIVNMSFPTDVIDREHIEGAKYAMMKDLLLEDFSGIITNVEEHHGYLDHSDKLEKAILQASGKPSKYMQSLLIAYRSFLTNDVGSDILKVQ